MDGMFSCCSAAISWLRSAIARCSVVSGNPVVQVKLLSEKPFTLYRPYQDFGMFQYRKGGVRPARRGHRGRGHHPHRPRASRRATAHRAEAPALSPRRIRALPWLRTLSGHHARGGHRARHALRVRLRLHVAGLPRRDARLPPARFCRGSHEQPPPPRRGRDVAVYFTTPAARSTAPGYFIDASSGSQKLSVADPPNGLRHNRGSAIDLVPAPSRPVSRPT